MRRYFYKDPLAAAWMAKHFGMKFDNLKEVIGGVEGDITLLALPRFVNDCRISRRYFIHPDSLHLLEPQTGDLLKPAMGNCFVAGDAYCMEATDRIIERNSTAFMWAESEAA